MMNETEKAIRALELLKERKVVPVSEEKMNEFLEMAIKALEQDTVPFDFELYQAGLMDLPKGMIDVLNEIRAEIEKAVWEDVVVSLDGADETRIPRLDPDDVFEIIDKYRAESEDKE